VLHYKVEVTLVAGSNLLEGLNSRNFCLFVLNLYSFLGDVEWIHTSLIGIFNQPTFLTSFLPALCYGSPTLWDRLGQVGLGQTQSCVYILSQDRDGPLAWV